MTDLFEKCHGDEGYFGRFRAAGDKYFSQPVLDSVPGPHMEFHGRPVIMWSVNSYLGLAGNEHIKQRARQALESYGTYSPMGSRMLTGNTSKHIELERRLAAYCFKDASVLFNYGYLGVTGTISSLIGPLDEVIIDKLSHASMIDGTVLAMAGRRFRPFKHNDLESLERQLIASSKRDRGGTLVVVEGVYGMRGDLADLPGICELTRRYGARIYVDDAHGFGVMGSSGRGTGEHFGVQEDIDLYFGTFAKAFSSIGGVTAGDEAVCDYVRYNARSNVFAKSLPMVYVETLSATLDEIEAHPEFRERMWHIARLLQHGLRELGFDLGDTASPITPVYVSTEKEETGMAILKTLREQFGIFCSGVTYPVVPRGVALYRLIPTAAHTEEDVEATLGAFKSIRDSFGLDLSTWKAKAV